MNLVCLVCCCACWLVFLWDHALHPKAELHTIIRFSPADVYHCFFVDPSVEMKVSVVDGKRTFDSPDHRKIR